MASQPSFKRTSHQECVSMWWFCIIYFPFDVIWPVFVVVFLSLCGSFFPFVHVMWLFMVAWSTPITFTLEGESPGLCHLCYPKASNQTGHLIIFCLCNCNLQICCTGTKYNNTVDDMELVNKFTCCLLVLE